MKRPYFGKDFESFPPRHPVRGGGLGAGKLSKERERKQAQHSLERRSCHDLSLLCQEKETNGRATKNARKKRYKEGGEKNDLHARESLFARQKKGQRGQQKSFLMDRKRKGKNQLLWSKREKGRGKKRLREKEKHRKKFPAHAIREE